MMIMLGMIVICKNMGLALISTDTNIKMSYIVSDHEHMVANYRFV